MTYEYKYKGRSFHRVAYAPYSFFKKQGIKGPPPSAFFGNALQLAKELSVNLRKGWQDWYVTLHDMYDQTGASGVLYEIGNEVWKSVWVRSDIYNSDCHCDL